MSTTKILCPVDFSPGSVSAVGVAARLAADQKAELVLVHSWFVPPSAFAEFTYPSELIQSIHDEAQRGLEVAVREAKEAGAPEASAKLLTGVPWIAICQEAADPDYSLLVIGTHGRTGVSRFLMGSVTEKVVRHSPCSVLVVRPDAVAKPFQHVLCPVDFSDSSHEAMLRTADLVRPGARITLLHTVELPGTWSMDVPVISFQETYRSGAEKLLATWVNDLKTRVDVPVNGVVRLGNPAGETLNALDADKSYDLVIMGSHGRTGIKRALLGSVAERVVRHARCPVLISRSS
jgi:nucleotide-binding universal stress UspA family protein